MFVTARAYGFTLDLLRERGVRLRRSGTTSVRASERRRLMGRSNGFATFASISMASRSNLFSRRHAPRRSPRALSRGLVCPSRLRVRESLSRTASPAPHCSSRGHLRRVVRRTSRVAPPTDPVSRNQGRHQPRRRRPGRSPSARVCRASRFFETEGPVCPPAEESHYARAESAELARSALKWLAAREDVVVILSPRYDWQVEPIMSLRWKVTPLMLDRPVPFGQLLRGSRCRHVGRRDDDARSSLRWHSSGHLFRERLVESPALGGSLGRLAIVRSSSKSCGTRPCSTEAPAPIAGEPRGDGRHRRQGGRLVLSTR